MALDTNYVYRYRCSDYGGLICEANFRDFDPLTDPWTHTNSADCRAAEKMGLLIGTRPSCSGRVMMGRKNRFLSFTFSEMTVNQKLFLGASTLIGGFVGFKLIKKEQTLGALGGAALGAVIGNSLNKFIK